MDVVDTGSDELRVGRFSSKRRITQLPIQGMRGKEVIWTPRHITSMAGPWIFRSTAHQACSNWIEIEIRHARKQIALGLNQVRLIPAFPQRAGPALALVKVPDIAPADGLHQGRYAFSRLWGCEQMKVIDHEHISMNADALSLRMFLEQREQHFIICGRRKDCFAVIAPLNDVVRMTGQCKSWKSGHTGLNLTPILPQLVSCFLTRLGVQRRQTCAPTVATMHYQNKWGTRCLLRST
jgi:hypothetical protein